jgi:hypothetical protein
MADMLTIGAAPQAAQTAVADRREDVELKQQWVAKLLDESACDGLLVLSQDHFTWLTSGGAARGSLDVESLPGLYYTREGRWLLSSNVDTQRIFDEEIDNLGFQLKEWPWHLGRRDLLDDLCSGKRVACDVPHGDCTYVGDVMQARRRVLTDYERACIRTLGQIVSHAVEATGRTFGQGDTEREIAGQLSHRLLHRGAVPVSITACGDGRSRGYRQAAYTSVPVRSYCVLTCVARKYGLCVQATRSISFGPGDPLLRKEHDAACKVAATYIASTWPDGIPKHILASGQRIYQLVGAEHEFYLAPQGFLIGRTPVESMLTLRSEELLQAHHAITWNATAGAAVSCDTFLVSEEGAQPVTAAENWPFKRIRIQGQEFLRPDILTR